MAGTSQTAPNAAFHNDPSCVTDSYLDTPSISIPVTGGFPVVMSFWNNFNLENGFDGGVVEISINGGPFADVRAAGGNASYNGTISSDFLSPIAGRSAWTGNSGGFVNSFVTLPPGAQGHNVVLRFRLATDCSGAGGGWYVDSISIAYFVSDASPTPPIRTPSPTPTATLPLPTATPTPTVTPPALTPTPTPSATPFGKIAFSSLPDHFESTYQIFTIDSNGANLMQVTFSPEHMSDDFGPKWSPDGTKIAFTRQPRPLPFLIHDFIMVIGPDGLFQLTNNANSDDSYPAWSPDGTKIAFTSNRDFNDEIYLMDANGSNQTRLTNNPDADFFPAWSPDGTRIAFTSNRDGNQEIYVMDANGSNQIRLTNNPAIDFYPAWSPDGTRIAFTSDRDGNDEVYVMNADGSNATNLTNNPANDTQPTWSPDGTRVAFLSGRDGDGEIFVMDANGSNQTRLTDNTFPDQEPDWQRRSQLPPPTATPTVTPPPPTPTPSPTATPSATATATPTPTATPPSTPPPPTASPTPTTTPAAQAINLSTRMRVQTGDNVGIGGFIVTGTSPKHVLLRAIGPSLTQSGVPDALADPVLELHGLGAFVTIINNNWRDDPAQEAAIIASGIPPTNDLESAIDAALAPGVYTAIIRGNGNTSGVALIELYDLNPPFASKLANISTRAFVSTGDNIVIGGFFLGGNNGDDRIVLRGIGPSLTVAGVPDALADPTLELRDGDGALLASNNDWQDDPIQAAELTAAGLAPTNQLESGIALMLPLGPYTALLAGLNNQTGIGLVEVYDRGSP